MRRKDAEMIMRHSGWLSSLPEDFRNDVLSRSVMKNFQPGEVVFRRGDPLGGIYGLVTGSVTLNSAPAHRRSRLIQTGLVGAWTGEGCFLTRQPRRVEMKVRAPTVMMYLPLAEMDALAATDPNGVRYFARILMFTAEVLIRVVNDLQITDARFRVAAILDRISNSGDQAAIPLTQAEIGEMAGATRRQVNAAMKEFSEKGWIRTNYRMIEVVEPKALRAFYQHDL